MKLAGANGQSLELWIKGYQYPELETGIEDINWLVVEGKVAHPRGGWSFREPCLLTFEVSSLAEWLESVDRIKDFDEELSFIEPNLRFNCRLEQPRAWVRVFFELECLPPWAITSDTEEEEFWVEFPISEADFRGAAQSLREQLEKYPQRVER